MTFDIRMSNHKTFKFQHSNVLHVPHDIRHSAFEWLAATHLTLGIRQSNIWPQDNFFVVVVLFTYYYFFSKGLFAIHVASERRSRKKKQNAKTDSANNGHRSACTSVQSGPFRM